MSQGGNPASTTGGDGVLPTAGTNSPSGGMGGSGSIAGSAPVGGMSSTAGSGMGGSGMGGSGNPMGGSPMGGSGGGTGDDPTTFFKALEGLRVDDPCTGTAPTTTNATCNHVDTTHEGKKTVTVGGMSGTTYDVDIQFRAVVEPATINGGTRPDTTTITQDGQMWRAKPYTIGGTVGDVTYQPWTFEVNSPQQVYYLNDYGKVAHETFLIDYTYTIQIAGGSTVALHFKDGNDHEIANWAQLKFAADSGVAPSMNGGQFVQLHVVKAKVHM